MLERLQDTVLDVAEAMWPNLVLLLCADLRRKSRGGTTPVGLEPLPGEGVGAGMNILK